MILITGGMGFVGSHLCESYVKDGEEVVIISKSMNKLKNIEGFKNKITLEVGDVTDFHWLENVVLKYKPDLIFHLAGQLTSYESFDNPLYDVDVNSKSTLVILEAIRKMKNGCRFVLGSTFWVLGKPEKLPVNEDTPCEPLNVYAADRLASEHHCRIYHEVHDTDAVVMRLTNTFGTREQYDNPKKAAINYLIYKGYIGEDIPIYASGKFFRDIIYVSDVVAAARTIASKGKAGECYFVGTNNATWFYDLGRWIEERTKGKVVYVNSPDFHKRINVGSILIDNSKLRGLGWNWSVSVSEGIERTLEYYRSIIRN